MQFHRYLSLVAVLLLAPLAVAEDFAPAIDPSRLDELDVQARRAWVATRLQWLDDANRAVLAPEAVEKQRKRFEQALDDFVQDRAGWREVVKQFEEELALGQRAAIEHLTRRFRIEAYQTFRSDRPQYEERRRHLAELLAASRDSASPDGERHKVVAWLLAATEAGEADASLPPLPRFDGHIDSQSAPLAIVESERPGPMPDGTVAPAVASRDSAVSIADSALPRTSTDRFATIAAVEVVRPRVLLTSAVVDVPTGVRQSEPRPHHVATVPSLGLPVEPLRFVESPQTTMLASTSRIPWRRPPSIAGVTRPDVKTRESAAPSFASTPSSVAGASGDPLAFARTSVDQLSMASSRGLGGSPGMAGNPGGVWPGRPASTSASFSRPESDGMSASTPESPKESAPSEANIDDRDESAQLAEFDPLTTPNKLAEINMEELAAQIAGTNMAMRKLAAKIYEDQAWDAESLGPILDQLAPLVARKDSLKLIRECIPESQRGGLGELETGSDLISDLGSKIAQARNDLAEGRFQGTPAQRRAQLVQLDRLSQRLASLVFND
ncbi:MAG TPA: hypothetical protein DD670_07545 [Planctomycetaceae bacterium]|nr:hypothetical protein [Planctomycetaceae bacterium]